MTPRALLLQFDEVIDDIMRLDDVLGYMNPEVHMPNTVSLDRGQREGRGLGGLPWAGWHGGDLSLCHGPAAALVLPRGPVPVGNQMLRCVHEPARLPADLLSCVAPRAIVTPGEGGQHRAEMAQTRGGDRDQRGGLANLGLGKGGSEMCLLQLQKPVPQLLVLFNDRPEPL